MHVLLEHLLSFLNGAINIHHSMRNINNSMIARLVSKLALKQLAARQLYESNDANIFSGLIKFSQGEEWI